ncbi:MAG: divergent polysaccharide deacetylase family protein [Rhodospirillaceae bacterium]
MLGLFKGKGGNKAKSSSKAEDDDDLPFARDDGPEEVLAGDDDAGKKGEKKPGRRFFGSLFGGGKKAAPKTGAKSKKPKKGKGEPTAPDPFDNPAVLALIAAEVSSLPPPADVPEDEVAAPVDEPDTDGARHNRPDVDMPDSGPAPVLDDMPFDDDDMPLGLDDLEDDAGKKGKRSAVLTGSVAAAVLLAVLGGGAWWMFGGSHDDTAGLEAGAEGSEDQLASATTPQSGRTITMAMPAIAPLQGTATEGNGRSLSRRPWLNETADAAPDSTGDASDTAAQAEPKPVEAPEKPADTAAAPEPAEVPPEPAAAATEPEPVPAEPETPVSLPPEQRLAVAADPVDDLPPLKEPLFPAEPADQHVMPAYERLPVPKAPPAALGKAPVVAVARNSPNGVMPVVGPQGEMAWKTYARPFDAPAGTPRIALVVSGLGLDPEATEAAIARLPAEVTLSFSPYAPKLAEQVTRARAHGHEVLLDLPLEDDQFPSHDPGPLSMLSLLPQAENITRLEQVMGRAVGYTGFVGTPGAKFGGSRVHMRTVLEQLAQRGLLYVHTAPASGLTGSGDLSAPSMMAVTHVDARPFREAIDGRLAWLEEVAKVRGATIAVASARPVTFERLVRWVADLPRKGVALAPASAVMPGPSS